VMNAAQWTVLDNVKNHWPYHTNIDRKVADKAYLWLVNNEYIKDGKITPAGEAALIDPSINIPGDEPVP
jgi:hypothetical protein